MHIQTFAKTAFIIISLSTTGMLAGCSSAPSSNEYSYKQAGTIHEVEMGTVTGIRSIRIEKDETPVGSAAGAILGGIAGSSVGQGRGRAAATTAGSVMGGIIGSKVDKNIQTQPGFEITVRQDNGKTVAIAQVADQQFSVGQRVKVLKSNGVARVTK